MATRKKIALSARQLTIAVWTGFAVLFILGLIQLAQGFIDTRNYSEKITAAIQQQTGRKVSIKGQVSVSLLPAPTLYIPGLELRDPASDAPAPAFAAELVSIRVPLFSVFSDHLRISSITLDRPVLELVQADDNLVHWDWMNTGLLKALSAGNEESGAALSIRINDGRILYRDSKTDKNTTIESINSWLTDAHALDAGGTFRIAGHDMSFAMNTGVADAQAKPVPFSLRISAGAKDSVELKGALDMSGDLPDLKGTFALKLENAPAWMKSSKPQEQHLFQQVLGGAKKEETVAQPLSITSDWAQHGLTIAMDNFRLEGLNSAGAGTVRLIWNGWKPDLAIDMKFSALGYDQWSQLLAAAFAHGDNEAIVYHDLNEAVANPIPTDVNIALNLKADEIHYGPQVWKDAQMSATIGAGAVTINQFTMKLQGDSTLTVFGVVSPSATSDLRFEGSMETSGKSLRNMLTVFDGSAADLPETGFGEFFAHSNMFISSQQLRLSEADVKLGDLHLNGGLVAYFDANPRVEADIKLKNINFDYFRDVWRERQKTVDKQEDFFLKFDKSMNFSWLKKLQTAIDFKVVVEHFTFLDRNGDNASFRLYAKNGDLGIYDINFIYPADITKGYFKLNVNGEQPALYLNLTTGDLNTDYFNVEPYRAEIKPVSATAAVVAIPAPPLPTDATGTANAATVPVLPPPVMPPQRPDDGKKLELTPQSEIFQLAALEDTAPPRAATGLDDLVKKRDRGNPYFAGENKKHWSEKLFDMSWLNGFSGELELNMGRLVHKDIALGNVKLKASFGNDLMVFKTFTFSYWGGQCGILGSLYGGKVPGFSISFTLVDAQLQALLASLTNRQNISGQVSVSAALASSGVNMLSWVSQAEGKMVLIGRNVYVQGLNMQGVVDSVAISRTSPDVLNSVNRAIFNGSTVFSVDGNLNIKNGMIRTPGIGLRTASSMGNMMGELKLVPWTMELSTLFQFPSMSTETVPTLTLQYSGTPDSGELKTDTSSLESFVAKRIISQ